MDGISGTLRVVNQCNPTNPPESLLPIQAQKQKAGALSVGPVIFQAVTLETYTTGWAQCAQRLAASGISLRHSGQGFVVGAAGAAGWLNFLSMYCIGSTIAK
jgi:hypothetical protein